MTSQGAGRPHVDPKEDIDHLAVWTSRGIKIIATVITACFLWIQFSGESLSFLFETFEPRLFRKIIIAVYFASWVYGTLLDVAAQRDAYGIDPNRGAIRPGDWLTLSGFLIIGIIVIWSSELNDRVFVIMLTVFHTFVGTIGWLYLVRRTKPWIDASLSRYEESHDYFSLERLARIRYYICGRWIVRKFVVMSFLILLLNLAVFNNAAREAAVRWIAQLTADVPGPTINALIPTIGFGVYVLTGEAWQWAQRINVVASLKALNALRREYRLEPVAPIGRQPTTHF